MKRPQGAANLYIKWASYYGRWTTPDGRRVNRKIGEARVGGEPSGLTGTQAERGLRSPCVAARCCRGVFARDAAVR
jgi:hypothetical protein